MPGNVDGSTSPLVLAGLRPGDERVYRSILRASGTSRRRLTEVTGLPVAELDEVLTRFAEVGLVHVVDDSVHAEPPQDALGRVIEGEAERLRHANRQVDALRNLLPGLIAEHAAWSGSASGSVDVRAVAGGDVVALLRSLAEESTGDVMWFRPDQWRLPVAGEIDALVRQLARSGRRSRAIYPARVLEEAPEVLRSRAEAGELVRIVAAVPTRIAVFGETGALLSDRWAESTGRRLVVREHSLVGALRTLFESAWERAMSVPGLEVGPADTGGARRLLLLQLARGAKDEQIARALGLSLRTVRRRVAEIMDELGAESRFQAGAEAVRRGWI